MAKRKSRKRRGPRPAPQREAAAGGYARSRARDEAARAALEPLRPANLVALAFGYNAGEDTLSPGSEATGSVAAALICAVVAYGMWKARYWAVLGMQTLLALTLVFASLALIGAASWWALCLLLLIIVTAGTLFWFLVKAMARIQMPERPGTQRTGR
jgi:hypothetical protein